MDALCHSDGSTIAIKADARYQKTEQSIYQVLRRALRMRRINLRTGDICRHATITRPTFYAHYRDSDAALHGYESSLRSDFLRRLPHLAQNRELIFTILLRFVHDQKNYFIATIPNANFWLLRKLLCDLRPLLAKTAANKVYEVYAQQQIAIICCWVKYEACAKGKIPFYVTKLCTTRLMDLGL